MLLLAMTLAAHAQEAAPKDGPDADEVARVGLGAYVGGTFSGSADVGGALRWRPAKAFAVEPTAFVSREAYTLEEEGLSVTAGYDRKFAWGAGATLRLGRPRVAGLLGVQHAEQRSWYEEKENQVVPQERSRYAATSVLAGVGLERRVAPHVTVGADVLVPLVSLSRWELEVDDDSATYDGLVLAFDPSVRLTVLFWP